MRKRYKNKLRSCAMCKPHKRGYENRWKPKEAALLSEFEDYDNWIWACPSTNNGPSEKAA